jgi:hypothetical protein
MCKHKSTITKNAGKATTILMAMPSGRYGAMRIAQWSAIRGFMQSH